MNTTTNDIRVTTSGAFTAAYLELIPRLDLLTKKKVVTAATSIGTGETSIPNRLRRGEAVDVVIVADGVLLGFIKDGLIMAESYTPLARSVIGMAVRARAGVRAGRAGVRPESVLYGVRRVTEAHGEKTSLWGFLWSRNFTFDVSRPTLGALRNDDGNVFS